MKHERQGRAPRWWHWVPFGLALLGLLSLIAGLVTAQTGRTILQIAVVALILSWLAIWAWPRIGRDRKSL